VFAGSSDRWFIARPPLPLDPFDDVAPGPARGAVTGHR